MALVSTHDSNPPENAEVVVINDQYQALCWMENDYVMAAVVVEIGGLDFATNRHTFIHDDNGRKKYVEDLRDATVFAHGHWKWDGCANIMFDSCALNCMLHFCDVSDYRKFSEIGIVLYEHASKKISVYER